MQFDRAISWEDLSTHRTWMWFFTIVSLHVQVQAERQGKFTAAQVTLMMGFCLHTVFRLHVPLQAYLLLESHWTFWAGKTSLIHMHMSTMKLQLAANFERFATMFTYVWPHIAVHCCCVLMQINDGLEPFTTFFTNMGSCITVLHCYMMLQMYRHLVLFLTNAASVRTCITMT